MKSRKEERVDMPNPGRREGLAMAFCSCSLPFAASSSAPIQSVNGRTRALPSKAPLMVTSQSRSGGRGRRVWRRRKLTKKDDLLQYKMERIPFLEEQERKIKETGKLLTMDIERLLLSEDNRFDFVNDVAAESKEYVENNRDEYGGTKKAILHVLSNRVNDSGFYRPEAYSEPDPFRPGPGYLKEEFT